MNFKDKRFCVYKHINKVTGAVRYIGNGNYSGGNKRPFSKVDRSEAHLNEWEELEVVIVRDSLTKVEAIKLEQELISQSSHLNLLNKHTDFKPKLDYSFAYLSEHFKIDYDSPTLLSWKKCSKFSVKTEGDATGTSLNSKGYNLVHLNGRTLVSHKVIYVLHHRIDLDDLMAVDHLDGNRSNNNPVNLKLKTFAENSRNKLKYKNNATGTTGVCFVSRGGKRSDAFIATWSDTSSNQKRKEFSVNKYGYEEARRLATEHRELQIELMKSSGYSDRHGK